ncbi:MAG: winged helix DNA-binding domain-containing protein, partial [Actinomycetota bacterium]|nr:winged helix DNA-binding domain-containing protein [Actinomycetota bacterium]
LVKHLAMRRTLFAFPRETLPFAQAGASARVAATERRRVKQQIEAAGVHPDGGRWLEDACELVLGALSDGRQDTMAEIRKDIPLLEGSVEFGVGKRWGGRVAIAPWVLTVLSAEGRVVRATNDGGWTTSRPRWASTESWLGRPLQPPSEAEGVAELVRQWLRAFGPGTEADIKWWLGSTLAAVRRALADVGAVEVDLDGHTGYLLPDDLEPTEPVELWGALLPALDPTTMGWTERDWYLGPYKQQLFDTAGNAGPTVWWDGRIVGGWRQSESGDVVVQLLEDIGSGGTVTVEAEAARLTPWLAGKRVLPRFPSPLFAATGG